jgi:hypothetical protein
MGLLAVTDVLDCPLSGILKNATFWKLDLFPSSDKAA